MAKLPALIFLAAVLAHPVAARAAAGCDSYPDVPVGVTPVFDEPGYDFSRNIAEIQTLGRDPQYSIPHNEVITLGITRYRPVIELRVPIVIESVNGGLACAHVERADVTVGYRNVIVHVAHEIPGRTCGFRETMLHEQKHIDVNRQLLHEFVPKIEARLKEYLRLYGVFRVQNAAYAENLLHEKLNAILKELIDGMRDENVKRQMQVDSAQEYARLANICDGELTAVADRYRQAGR